MISAAPRSARANRERLVGHGARQEPQQPLIGLPTSWSNAAMRRFSDLAFAELQLVAIAAAELAHRVE